VRGAPLAREGADQARVRGATVTRAGTGRGRGCTRASDRNVPTSTRGVSALGPQESGACTRASRARDTCARRRPQAQEGASLPGAATTGSGGPGWGGA